MRLLMYKPFLEVDNDGHLIFFLCRWNRPLRSRMGCKRESSRRSVPIFAWCHFCYHYVFGEAFRKVWSNITDARYNNRCEAASVTRQKHSKMLSIYIILPNVLYYDINKAIDWLNDLTTTLQKLFYYNQTFLIDFWVLKLISQAKFHQNVGLLK